MQLAVCFAGEYRFSSTLLYTYLNLVYRNENTNFFSRRGSSQRFFFQVGVRRGDFVFTWGVGAARGHRCAAAPLLAAEKQSITAGDHHRVRQFSHLFTHLTPTFFN